MKMSLGFCLFIQIFISLFCPMQPGVSAPRFLLDGSECVVASPLVHLPEGLLSAADLVDIWKEL